MFELSIVFSFVIKLLGFFFSFFSSAVKIFFFFGSRLLLYSTRPVD